jgi:ankyrin repeat protein
MTTALPERPDLDQLRHRAKDLLRAARAGNPDALNRLRAQLPLRPGATVRLSTAQLVIAREHGFASWPALVAQIEAATADLVGQLTDLVTHSVRGHFDAPAAQAGWVARARRLLAEHPEVVGYDVRVAAVLGEPDPVRRLLSVDPGLATRPDDRAGWPPLLFACSSRWHRIDPARSGGLVAVAELLLNAGADPNTAVEGSAGSGRCAALYAAAGLANHTALATLLLERGADPDTPAALYHTVFHPDHACLRLLLQHGARAEGAAALGAAISIADTTAIRLLLEAGVDPGQPIPADALGQAGHGQPPIPAVRAALQSHCDTEAIDLLLTHRAAPDQESDGGLSSCRLAVRRGDPALAETLRRHGARDDSSAVDRLLGACADADRAAVDVLLAEHPEVLAALSVHDHALLVDAAEHRGLPPVALMLELGFPAGARRDSDGVTALHVAAHAGRADVVALLLAHGADVHARDGEYHATALSWASVGSGDPPRHHPDGDWITTVQALFDAGAALDEGWSIGKPPSDEVAALLLAYGIGPDTDTDTDIDIDTDTPVAVAVVDAIRTGDVAGLRRLLADHPGLATARFGDTGPDGMSRTLLHVATDWPGHFPNGTATVAALVAAGADVNARFTGPHTETPLHWAASSNDVAVLDALLDAGADIDAAGAVIGGGTPLADARAFGQWKAAHRLVQRGARTTLQDAATLGLLDQVRDGFAAPTPPGPDDTNRAFWGACHGGQQTTAAYLLDRGADLNWIPPWEDRTPLDAAARSGATDLVEWLRTRSAKSATELD